MTAQTGDLSVGKSASSVAALQTNSLFVFELISRDNHGNGLKYTNPFLLHKGLEDLSSNFNVDILGQCRCTRILESDSLMAA